MQRILKCAINPCFDLLPPEMGSEWAAVNLLAIGHIETGFTTRKQYGSGPARGYWQFEGGKSAAFHGIFNHRNTAQHAEALAFKRGYGGWNIAQLFTRLLYDDVFAAGCARLLLWTDPHALPALPSTSFKAYIRTWRPGAYERGTEAQRRAMEEKYYKGFQQAQDIVFNGGVHA